MTIVIYTKSTCPFCAKAKKLLHSKNVSFEEISIDGQSDLREEMVKRASGRTTVPQIFINDRHIGGCDDLYALEAQGKLDPILKM